MARPYILPDCDDCSPNQPKVLMSQAQVLGLYNQENKEAKYKNVTNVVKDWYRAKALEAGWKSAEFSGSQCILDSGLENNKKKK